MRNVTVEAAAATIRHDERMARMYAGIKKRRGASKAKAAVARRMLEVMWHMPANNESYRTQNRHMTQQKCKKMQSVANTS